MSHVYLVDPHDSDVVLPTIPPALVIGLKDCHCQHWFLSWLLRIDEIKIWLYFQHIVHNTFQHGPSEPCVILFGNIHKCLLRKKIRVTHYVPLIYCFFSSTKSLCLHGTQEQIQRTLWRAFRLWERESIMSYSPSKSRPPPCKTNTLLTHRSLIERCASATLLRLAWGMLSGVDFANSTMLWVSVSNYKVLLRFLQAVGRGVQTMCEVVFVWRRGEAALCLTQQGSL